jgi:hypothetical protein
MYEGSYLLQCFPQFANFVKVKVFALARDLLISKPIQTSLLLLSLLRWKASLIGQPYLAFLLILPKQKKNLDYGRCC